MRTASDETLANDRRRPKRAGLLWQCVVAAVILACFAAWQWVRTRGGPDMYALPAVASGNRFKVRDGNLIWRTSANTLVIHSVPVSGGHERILAEDGPLFAPPSWEFGLMFGSRDILYRTQQINGDLVRNAAIDGSNPIFPRPALQPMAGGMSGAGVRRKNSTDLSGIPMAPPSVGPDYLLSESGTSGHSDTARRRIAASLPPIVRLRRLPLTGGTPIDVPGVEARPNTTVGGDWVYWLRARMDDLYEVRRGAAKWRELAGHSDLMATSLLTGETRQLATGVPATALLVADERGVFWTLPQAYPSKSRDLYYSRPTDHNPNVVRGYDGNLLAMPPVEYHGRLYWLISAQRTVLWRGDWLYSANLDGSDRRTVLESSRIGKLLRTPLTIHRGNLYVFMQDDVHGKRQRGRPIVLTPPIALARLHPERADPIEIACPDVHGSTFDNDYLYGISTIARRPLRDYLVHDDANIEDEDVLCRYRLPK